MKFIYIGIGFLSLGLGIIGIFLPVLPTVPFLLLSSWCFAKGSDRFHKWFKSTKIYKNHLESFEKNRSMTMKTKMKILVITTAILLFVVYRYDILAMRIVILSLIAFKWWYFMKVIKTADPSESSTQSDII